MSKAEELRKKMNRNVAPTFTPRQSVSIQPLPQTQDEARTEQKKPLTPVKEVTPEEKGELVGLFARVSKEDKRWLDHYRIDAGKDLGDVVSEAIQLLKKQSGSK